jgi:hypothetical protein
MFCPKFMYFRYQIALFQHSFNCGSSIKLRWGYLSCVYDTRVQTVPLFLVRWTERFCCITHTVCGVHGEGLWWPGVCTALTNVSRFWTTLELRMEGGVVMLKQDCYFNFHLVCSLWSHLSKLLKLRRGTHVIWSTLWRKGGGVTRGGVASVQLLQHCQY